MSWKSVPLFLLNFLQFPSTKESNPCFLVALLQLEMKIPPRLFISRLCLSHFIKGEWLMFSLRQYCLDFSIFPMFTFQPHLLPTISWWTRNKSDKCLKHMTSSTLVKCNCMIVSVVMPSYPNVTLFPWYLISEYWTTARTLNMKINHNIL